MAGLEEAESEVADDLELSDPEDDDLADAAVVRSPTLNPNGNAYLLHGSQRAALSPLGVEDRDGAGSLSFVDTKASIGPRSGPIETGALHLGAGENGGTAEGGVGSGANGGPSDANTSGVSEGLGSAVQRVQAQLEEEIRARRRAEEERAAEAALRVKVEESKAAAFARFRVLAQEAAKQREELTRQKEELARRLDAEAAKVRLLEEGIREQRSDLSRRLQEGSERLAAEERARADAAKARDAARAEMEKATLVLSGEAARIIAKLGGGTSASGGSLRGASTSPPKAAPGLAAVVHALKRHLEDAVDEAVRQRDAAGAQCEQQAVHSAIEVSQLEAAVAQLRSECDSKQADADRWQKAAESLDGHATELVKQLEAVEGRLAAAEQRADEAEKRARAAEVESRKLRAGGEEHKRAAEEARQRARDLDARVAGLEADVAAAVSASDQAASSLSLEREGREQLEREAELRRVQAVESGAGGGEEGADKGHSTEWLEERRDLEAKLDAAVAESGALLAQLSSATSALRKEEEKVAALQGDAVASSAEMARPTAAPGEESASTGIDKLQGEVEALHKEVRDAHRRCQEAESGLAAEAARREAAERQHEAAQSKVASVEEEARELRQQVHLLDQSLTRARSEAEAGRELVRGKQRDAEQWKARCAQLESRVVVLLDEVSKLQSHVADVEEECARWRAAASEEAAAGSAVADELHQATEQVMTLQVQLNDVTKLAEESAAKLRSKEDIAAAAMAAQAAAERSLQAMDRRTAEMRDRMEEMARQLEQTESQRERHSFQPGCWNSLLLWSNGGAVRQARDAAPSAEMEQLMEPLAG